MVNRYFYTSVYINEFNLYCVIMGNNLYPYNETKFYLNNYKLNIINRQSDSLFPSQIFISKNIYNYLNSKFYAN